MHSRTNDRLSQQPPQQQQQQPQPTQAPVTPQIMNNTSGLKVRNDLMPQGASINNAQGHFGNGVTSVTNPMINPSNNQTMHANPNRGSKAGSNDLPPSSGSPDGGGPKTKAMLKGWSSLAQASSASKAQERQQKASDTFNAFKKAAQEKQERERQLQEQQESIRMKKEAAERQRLQQESDKRRDREEEEALEQARMAMMNRPRQAAENRGGQTPTMTTNHNSSFPDQVVANAGSAQSGSDHPNNPESDADAERARIERERQRQREQERRRREAKANQIDMNMQSDILEAFERNITMS